MNLSLPLGFVCAFGLTVLILTGLEPAIRLATRFEIQTITTQTKLL
jgi:hypothetical protein